MHSRKNPNFDRLISQLGYTQKSISSSAAASVVMQNGQIVWEWYSGYHDHQQDARKVDENSQFNIVSGRKTYIAFAVAYALFHGKINSIDDTVDNYISYLSIKRIKGTTIRHLLTHCHGLEERDGKIVKVFESGTNWNGRQLLSESLFEQITTIQSPQNLPSSLPSQGYLWWVQGNNNSSTSEIGGRVPSGSFQVLGYTGCACLVLPTYNAVAVRMFNQTGRNQHPDFNYLTDMRQFGDVVSDCLRHKF